VKDNIRAMRGSLFELLLGVELFDGGADGGIGSKFTARRRTMNRAKSPGAKNVEDIHPSLSPIVYGNRTGRGFVSAGLEFCFVGRFNFCDALLELLSAVADRTSFFSRKIYYTSCRSSNATSFTWKKEGDLAL
jgi:hypothetical protein